VSEFEGILTEIVTTLLSSGADPNIAVRSALKTPLHYAAYRGNVGIVNNLIEYGADTSRVDQESVTPLQAALKAAWLCEERPHPLRYREIISILQEANMR
jgi:ankyrin repeat protein